MKDVTFYTKLNCPLCDEAYQMLISVAFDRPLKIEVLDITHTHNDLEAAKYADRIPVVALSQPNAELYWPFTLNDLKDFLTQ